MAYRDPFTEQHGHDQRHNEAPPFDPYSNSQPHEAYDQSGYDPYAPSAYRDYPATQQPVNAGATEYAKKEGNEYNSGGFALANTGRSVYLSPYLPYRSFYLHSRSQNFRRWRYEHHGGSLWTKGSRGRCIGRFCCCTLMSALFLIISILLALFLWIRPPNVIVGSVWAPSTGEIQVGTNSVQLNLAINITANNPNYFSVSFPSIKANIYYPINNTYIGGGNQSDVTFPSHTNKTITFPFSIEYTTTMPSSSQIFADLATKCGLNGGTKSDITVDYDITLDLRVLFFTISPTISNSASFLCPLSSDDLSGILSSLLGNSG
ncbi:hypothetical protein ID866_3503 [Astraeus odoratus]|nr:hypothetical protein ID866_3503 [Astraeus odoratus]